MPSSTPLWQQRLCPTCCCFLPPAGTNEEDELIASWFASFDVSPTRGFLPPYNPLVRLPQPEFQPHEDVALALPRLLTSSTARPAIRALPQLGAATTHRLLAGDERHQRRALLLFGGLASAYVWGGGEDAVPSDVLPACIAVPLYQIGQDLETPPILSHQSNCLYNWRPVVAALGAPYSPEPLKAQDLALTFSFTGGDNERMFYLLTLEIEALGARALPLLEKTRRRTVAGAGPSAVEKHEHNMIENLSQVRAFIQAMQQVLLSMPRFVDPTFFYTRVRPYLSGWLNNPSLPVGVLYTAVGSDSNNGDHAGQRLQFSGGSAAQSSIVTALDLYLGVNHDEEGKDSRSSYAFLKQMREYMPRGHRRFLDALEHDMVMVDNAPSSIRRYVLGRLQENVALREAYDGCVDALVAFRKSHLGIVKLYIADQQGGGVVKAKEGKGRLEEAAGGKGTGGQTPMEFLAPLRQQTIDSLLLKREST